MIASSVFAVSAVGSLAGTYLSRNKQHEGTTLQLEGTKQLGKRSDGSFPRELRDEQISRIRVFFGDQMFEKLENSFVVVVGLGGVGSHAANMLARSGVSRIRLVDFDQVTLSSLNRHAVATMDDVGQSKADVLRRALLRVVPWCDIEAITEMFKGEAAERLLGGQPDFVLDCIDDVSTKAELIAYCVKNGLKVLTSMGAGGKADPTRIRIASLADCMNDPLASKIKWKLKKHNVQSEDVLSVFSIEKPVVDLLPLDEEQKLAPQDYGVVDYFRIRVMPVLGTSPAMFGQSMASYILCALAGKLYEPEACERLSKNLKHKIRQTFQSTELRRFKTTQDIDLDDDDVEFIVQQMWHNRCAFSGRKMGGHAPLILTRWCADQPPHPFNLVLLMRPHALELEEKGHEAFPADARERIEDRLRWAKDVCLGSWSPHKTSDNNGEDNKVAASLTKKEEGKEEGKNDSTREQTSSGRNFIVSIISTSTACQTTVLVGAILSSFLLGYMSGRRIH